MYGTLSLSENHRVWSPSSRVTPGKRPVKAFCCRGQSNSIYSPNQLPKTSLWVWGRLWDVGDLARVAETGDHLLSKLCCLQNKGDPRQEQRGTERGRPLEKAGRQEGAVGLLTCRCQQSVVILEESSWMRRALQLLHRMWPSKG